MTILVIMVAIQTVVIGVLVAHSLDNSRAWSALGSQRRVSLLDWFLCR